MSQGFDDVRARLHEARKTADEAAHRLETLMTRAAQRARRRADAVICRLSPARLAARVSDGRVRFAVLSAARDAAIGARLDDARTRFQVGIASLDALSPLAVLKRGYALAQDEQGRLLRDAREVEIGDHLRLRLSEGILHCRVEEKEESV